MTNINQAIFNSVLADHERTPIILGKPRGLTDSITSQYPVHTKLYEQLRVQDWTEKEFRFEMCAVEFKKVDPLVAKDMIRTIAWQWETDSTAANTLAVILGSVVSSSEVWTGYQRIADNESIHALTYAKIVQQSFEEPLKVMADVLADKEALQRLVVVAAVFERAAISAHRWALFQLAPKLYPLTPREQYLIYDDIFLYLVALLIMERVQFSASFGVTFGICSTNTFIPIGDAVQRIAQDEFEIHVPFGRETLTRLVQTDRGAEAFKNNRDIIITMLNEAVEQETNWVDVMHADGHENPGFGPDDLKAWVYYSAAFPANMFDIVNDVKFPKVTELPLPYMADRVSLAALQPSPQEAPSTQYLVNAVERDDEGKTFDTDGLY
jgi:ribonucleoside-diphosphate reductase beta chain